MTKRVRFEFQLEAGQRKVLKAAAGRAGTSEAEVLRRAIRLLAREAAGELFVRDEGVMRQVDWRC
jgi:hypothetical protein